WVFTMGRALSVDVEQLRGNFDHDAIARRFLSEKEQCQLAALAPPERYHGFFRCWTRKEAYIKARGTGLSLPLHQFDASLRPGMGVRCYLPVLIAQKRRTGRCRTSVLA